MLSSEFAFIVRLNLKVIIGITWISQLSQAISLDLFKIHTSNILVYSQHILISSQLLSDFFKLEYLIWYNKMGLLQHLRSSWHLIYWFYSFYKWQDIIAIVWDFRSKRKINLLYLLLCLLKYYSLQLVCLL